MIRDTTDRKGVQKFKIHAVEADIVLNRFGLHVSNGAMYVLEEKLEAVRKLRADIKEYLDGVEKACEPAEKVFEGYERTVEVVLATLEDQNWSRDAASDAVDAVDDRYGDGLDEEALRTLEDRVRAVLKTEFDTEDERRLAVREEINEYDPLVELFRTRCHKGISDKHEKVDKEYQERIGQLLTELEEPHHTVEDLRERVASYCQSVPEQQYAGVESATEADLAALNPLDDAYALIEDENQKEPSVIQPLTIRANKGDRIEIEFVNHLDRPASIHQTSLPYDVETSDGMAVGNNPDTTAAPESAEPDNEVTYTWHATHQGTHFFYDGANQAIDSADEPPQEANLLARGLFGAIVVEPPEAEWTDPQTGGELNSGVRADIHDPSRFESSYREFVVFYHSPVGTAPDINWPTVLKEQSIHAINYRSDPGGQRVNDEFPESDKEELFYHSWTNGDPGGGDNVYTAYRGDPIKFCFVGASHEENHVHHLHQHRYKEVPQTEAPTIDAQSIGLGDTYESYLVAGHGPGTVRPDMTFKEAFTESGAGYMHGTAGDILFHCHLFPHYAEGMWGFMRVLDKKHDFLEPLPGTCIVDDTADLRENNHAILDPDADEPGFPTFIADAIEQVRGVDDPVGYGAPEPPELQQPNGREPTAMERAALKDEIPPGAPYADPVEEADQEANRIVEYTIRVMRAEIAYNDAGEHDPDGIVYVADKVRIQPGPGKTEADVVGVTSGWEPIEDAELVKNGDLNPEPLFLRANVGDRVDVKLINELDEIEMEEKRPFDASIHPHYVGYDVLASDSLPNGFNYYQGTEPTRVTGPEQGNVSRWYADEEGTIYFHDHIFAIKQGVHGMFCGLIVEPQGSRWRDPYSGERVFSGAKADIFPPDEDDTEPFREQALHYHDFAPLRKPNGDYVNPETEHTVNKGTMAINYRNAPYYHRDTADPAYVHSSRVHGDPPTPVIEAHDGDPIRIRWFQGCYEEQHTFAVHGLRTEREGLPAEASVSKYLGTSEAFTFEIPAAETERNGDELANPDGLPVRDYLYGSTIVDDLWTGMWGLVRLWGGDVRHLQPLGDEAPGDHIEQSELHKMGHPAPHSEVDWTVKGQRAPDNYSLNAGESLFDGAVGLLEKAVDDLLDGIDLGDDIEQAIQEHLDDLNGQRATLLPADVHARRSSVGGKPPIPHSDGELPCDKEGKDRSEDRDKERDEADDVREYDVTAFLTEIPYNDHGDRDPYGVVFALDRYVEEIKNGDREPEPLFLRMNEDERLRVNLTNKLPADLDNDHPDPEMLVPQSWERSKRVSLHPLALQYDVNAAAGVTAGFNYDTTVGRGETFTYEWAPSSDIEAVCLWDMADLRSTRHHGAYGQVHVEPEDAIPLTPDTSEPAVHGGSALVSTADEASDFREHGLLFADAQFITNRYDPTSCVVPRSAEGEHGGLAERSPCTQVPEDTEDQGYGGVNYRSEPFSHRFETNDAQHLVYSSSVHEDPNTPVVEAEVGDPIRFRVSCAADKARGITLHLAGHEWERFTGVDASPAIGVDGQFGPGTARTLDLLGGAGGLEGHAGDYLYQETKQRRRLESGLWGIFRVHDTEDSDSTVQPLPDRADDVSLADRPGYTVEAGTDVTGTGATDVVVGVPGSDLGAANAGGVYLFENTNSSAVSHLAEADLILPAETPGTRAGNTITIVDRADDAEVDLRIGTANGEIVVPGGRHLRAYINQATEADGATSPLARFVRRALPANEWPVVPLSSATESE